MDKTFVVDVVDPKSEGAWVPYVIARGYSVRQLLDKNWDGYEFRVRRMQDGEFNYVRSQIEERWHTRNPVLTLTDSYDFDAEADLDEC